MSFLFKPELRKAILDGAKIQTRRPIKHGERLIDDAPQSHVLTPSGRLKWQEGRDYAVPYGRGKVGAWYYRTWDTNRRVEVNIKAVESGRYIHYSGVRPFRILVNKLREECVHEISFEDAQAEGFDDEIAFWWTWCDLYRKHLKKYIAGATSVDHARAVMRDWNFPPVWVVSFELV